ncbi:hypothetical protein ACTMU2_38790 [Cupriavidus basilensis]
MLGDDVAVVRRKKTSANWKSMHATPAPEAKDVLASNAQSADRDHRRSRQRLPASAAPAPTSNWPGR